jgi:hypothetical protein
MIRAKCNRRDAEEDEERREENSVFVFSSYLGVLGTSAVAFLFFEQQL